MKSYKDILKIELVMKNYYDGWTIKGMRKKLKEIEEKEKKGKQNKPPNKL